MHNADLYHDNNNIQKKTATECIEKYGMKIIWKSDNNRILDLGCGEGSITTMLKKYLPKKVTVVGYDINEEMVQFANRHYGDEQTSFTVLDMTGDLPEEARGSFSHVFSFFAINWVINQRSTFNNIYNLLEPDGECFLVIVGFNPIFDVYRNLARYNKWKPWVYDVERFISPYHDQQEPHKDIKKMMENIGFDNINTVNNHMIYTYSDMEAMKGSFIAISPFKIPEEMMNDFWEDYAYELKSLKGCEDALKDIKFNYKIITVHGHKPRSK